MQKEISEENEQGYCYGQGYDHASGNYELSPEETVAQGFDVLVCKNAGYIGEYKQGYIDGYNQQTHLLECLVNLVNKGNEKYILRLQILQLNKFIKENA